MSILERVEPYIFQCLTFHQFHLNRPTHRIMSMTTRDTSQPVCNLWYSETEKRVKVEHISTVKGWERKKIASRMLRAIMNFFPGKEIVADLCIRNQIVVKFFLRNGFLICSRPIETCCCTLRYRPSVLGASNMFIRAFGMQNYRKAGFVIQNAQGNYLLVQNYGSKWGFPKGSKNVEDKTSLHCALREVKEETGIWLKFEEISQQRAEISSNLVLFFATTARDFKINKIDSPIEITDIRWVSIEEMQNLPLNSSSKQWIRRRRN